MNFTEFFVFCNFFSTAASCSVTRILSIVVQETQSLNRCDSDVQINALARCRMCNEKFFILITMQLVWYTIGISHSFYGHHVRLIASVALNYITP